MKKIILLLCLGLLGCSGSNNPQTAKNSGFEFQPVDLAMKMPRVDIHNDDAILKSTGVPVKKSVLAAIRKISQRRFMSLVNHYWVHKLN